MKLGNDSSLAPPRSARRAEQGFTIIETMFVLAIAGVILLIVFEAIPALTRNGRNNQRKQDVQTILEAVSHYELNNSGNIPDGSNGNFLQNAKLTYYDGSSPQYLSGGGTCSLTLSSGVGVCAPGTSATAVSETNNNADTVYVINYRKCNPNNVGASMNQGAGYNDVVALYAIETGSATAPQCQQL